MKKLYLFLCPLLLVAKAEASGVLLEELVEKQAELLLCIQKERPAITTSKHPEGISTTRDACEAEFRTIARDAYKAKLHAMLKYVERTRQDLDDLEAAEQQQKADFTAALQRLSLWRSDDAPPDGLGCALQ